MIAWIVSNFGRLYKATVRGALNLTVSFAFLVLVAVLILCGSVWLANDICTTFAEKVGFVSSIATLLGLGFTFLQVIETKSLARAASEAAEKSILELRANDYRYSLLIASRLLAEINTHLQYHTWKIAALRLHDLAYQCLALARIRPGVDDQWRGYSQASRWWASRFDQGQNNRPFDYDVEAWNQLFERLWDKVDRESQPFSQS